MPWRHLRDIKFTEPRPSDNSHPPLPQPARCFSAHSSPFINTDQSLRSMSSLSLKRGPGESSLSLGTTAGSSLKSGLSCFPRRHPKAAWELISEVPLGTRSSAQPLFTSSFLRSPHPVLYVVVTLESKAMGGFLIFYFPLDLTLSLKKTVVKYI